jgi:hypothetical protein
VLLILPAIQFGTSYRYEKAALTTDALAIAKQLSERARSDPEIWDLDEDVLTTYMATTRARLHGWLVSLVDVNGQTVQEFQAAPSGPTIGAMADVTGNTGPVGRWAGFSSLPVYCPS